MASPLSILKTVLNLNHNCMHVTSCETAMVTVHRFGETFEQNRIYVHAKPYERVRKLCPFCMKKCPGYDKKYGTESTWRAPNLNGVPVHICYQPQRIECPEHGVLTEYIPWADGKSRPEQLLPCSKTLTGGQSETVLRQPMTALNPT